MKKFGLLHLILTIIILLPFSLHVQLSVDATSTDYTIDFDSNVSGVNNGQYDGSGFDPSPSVGDLDSDAWATSGMSDGTLNFGGTITSGDHARGTSTGGEITGGFYAFNIGGGDYTFGIQPGGSD